MSVENEGRTRFGLWLCAKMSHSFQVPRIRRSFVEAIIAGDHRLLVDVIVRLVWPESGNNSGFETVTSRAGRSSETRSFSGVCPGGSPTRAAPGSIHTRATGWQVLVLCMASGHHAGVEYDSRQSYEISFIFRLFGATNAFSISFDGVTLIAGTSVIETRWLFFDFTAGDV